MPKGTPPADRANAQKRARVSQTDIPRHTLDDALRIAGALSDQFAKKPTKPYYIADALKISPTSSRWRTLPGASVAFGLTTGGYNAPEIALTPLGRRVVTPTVEGDDLTAKREALLKPRVIREFLERYNDNPLPTERIGCNVLESDMGVAPDATKKTFDFILASARSVGLLKDAGGRTYVDLQATSAPPSPDPDERPDGVEDEVDDDLMVDADDDPLAPPDPPAPRVNRKVFISHGKDKAIVNQLKELLTYGDFAPVVSVERETTSKPVPDKVMDDMRACSAGIIHVGMERKVTDEGGTEHQMLNENVLIEIGAALALYGRRYILLVEQGATLPSNLQGLYQVRYEGTKLDGDATLKLLKAFKNFKPESASV
jgi:predicted nucleotide-binding protein